jgi:hypothetical protein
MAHLARVAIHGISITSPNPAIAGSGLSSRKAMTAKPMRAENPVLQRSKSPISSAMIALPPIALPIDADFPTVGRERMRESVRTL